MADEERLRALRSSLAADGFSLEVREHGDRVGVVISASPGACADCLVPKPLMRGILRNVLGVEEDAIDISYPRDCAASPGRRRFAPPQATPKQIEYEPGEPS